MNRVTLYFFRGWPGSGKSTLAKEYQQKGLFTHYYENDMFLYDENDTYVWSKERLAEAIKLTRQHVLAELQKGKSVGLCSVASHKATVVEWLKICKEHGWWLEVIDCNGDFENIHQVPKDKVKALKNNFQPWIKYNEDDVCLK